MAAALFVAATTSASGRQHQRTHGKEVIALPTRELLTGAQRTRLETIPEMDRRELARHHTLSDVDLTAVSVAGMRPTAWASPSSATSNAPPRG